MKPYLSRLCRRFRLNTLRQRLILVFGVCMLFCFALVASVSYISLQAAEKNRVETTMRADLLQVSEQIDADYYTLVQISQQMTTQGIIGAQMNAYLSADEHFERIRLSAEITTDINTMIFSHETISLVTYFSLDEASALGTAFFSNMPVRPGADPRSNSPVLSTDFLAMQSLHGSLNQLTDKKCLSLTRPILFSNGSQMLIYAEAYSKVLTELGGLADIRGVPYSLLLFDEDGNATYCSQPDAPLENITLPTIQFSSNGVGHVAGYSCVSSTSKFGFTYLLLVPESHYNRQLFAWVLGVGVVLLIMLALVITTVSLLVTLVYRPLQALGKDMDEVGKGNLIPAHHSFHMEEFDHLFRRFDEMKQEISTLLDNIRSQEKEKQQLEVDKLYYQINPHFLMNALNSVHWMAVANHQPEIDRFVYQLNYILGYSLGKTDQRATFRTELKSLELYLELQKERYDFNIWYEVEPGDYLDYPCARLILQPLAENAVCHNMNEFGNLWVTMGLKDDGRVHIVIRDDGCGFDPAEEGSGLSQPSGRAGKGIGLRYVQLTLFSFYGESAHIQIESQRGTGTTVTLSLPVRPNQKELL